MPDRQTAPRSFEAALVELEALVEKMEGGDLSLEDSVTAYERGVALHGYCEQALSAAERKVRILEPVRRWRRERGSPPRCAAGRGRA